MEEIANQFGIEEFAFADEQFMGHGRTGVDRALGIAEELLKRRLAFHWYVETRSSDVSLPVFAKLRKSGLRAVFMGLESGYIAGLMREGLELRERAEHARQQEIELGKKRQEVADLGRQIELEEKKVRDLDLWVNNWVRAQQIREFTLTLENLWKKQAVDLSADAPKGQQIIWMRQQADRLDPILPSPPSILDRKAELSRW